MNSYRVTWEIDIQAATPRKAAEKALAVQRTAGSSAVVFDVIESCGHYHKIDLDEDEATHEPCRTDGCDGDPDNGEGWDGYCGNCADRHDPV